MDAERITGSATGAAKPSPARWRNAGRSALMLPRVVALAVRAPRNSAVAWREFWSDVRSTGDGGDVLWDTSADLELAAYRVLAAEYFDTALPLVDLGCGNGRFTRGLADLSCRAVGVDLAEAAVDRAVVETRGAPGSLDFLAADITADGCGADLHDRYGDSNVFIRGVLHVLSPGERLLAARTIATLAGTGGRVLLAETDFRAGSLAYLQHLGATARRIPPALERAIAMLPRPRHFGATESAVTFPADEWEVLLERATTIRTVPTRTTTDPEPVPGYLAVLARRC